MNEELQKYYETYLDLFATDGWKQFINEMQEAFKQLDSVSTCKSTEELFFRQGQLEILTRLTFFEDSINGQMDEAKQQEAESNPLEH